MSCQYVKLANTLQHTATHYNTLQHCNTLQHIATHCNTLQHTATCCNADLELPRQYVEALFNSVAETYEDTIIPVISYQVDLNLFVYTCT